MPAGHGLRSRCRDVFSQGFRRHGIIPLTNYYRVYKIGDYVDIKVNSAVHTGMPHKGYHGKTGVVWNVTKRAVGVEVNKQVNGRIIKKRIHVRIEHVKPSRCREDFLARRQKNEELKKQAKSTGATLGRYELRRAVKGPREALMLTPDTHNCQTETVAPIPYDVLKEGIVG